MATEQGLYAQVVMIRRRESDDKKEKEKTNNTTSKENQKDQEVGSILIMSGQKKCLGHVNHIYIEKCIKLNLGAMI